MRRCLEDAPVRVVEGWDVGDYRRSHWGRLKMTWMESAGNDMKKLGL